MAIDRAKPSWFKMLSKQYDKCEDCGKRLLEVRHRQCPRAKYLHDIVEMAWLCNACDDERYFST